MRNWALLAAAALLVSHAQGACTGLSAGDAGTCPTAQCQAIETDFSDPSVFISSGSVNATSKGGTFVSEQTPSCASINDGKLVLSLKKSTSGAGYDGSTVYYSRWINYGTITATIKSGSTVPGVVSSLHLQDSKGSSLNMDWVGLSSNRVQTYTYTNGQVQLSQAIAPILAVNATSTFVKYKIVWLPDSISWYANGLAIRTLYRKDTWSEGEQRFNYPSNAARLSFSIWDSSKSINPPMTQSWAGSISSAYPDGTKFDMQVQSVSIDCYSNSTANNQGSIPVLHGTSNTTSASASPQKPQSSSVPAPAASYDLSNFGLAPSAASSKSEKSSSSAPTARDSGGGDDVSKYLAANSRNAASLSRGAGLLTSSLAVFAVVVISSI